MTAKEVTEKLGISNARLNQLVRCLKEGIDYERIHAKLFVYKKSALVKLKARKKKYLKKQSRV